MEKLAEIVKSLAEKYNLPMDQVVSAVDQVLCSKAFQRATSSDCGQVTSEGVIVFRERGVSLLGELKHPLARLLTEELEKILTDAATAVELEQWQQLHKQVIHARIERITPDGDLEVQIERNGAFGEIVAAILGRCSRRNQSPRDRQMLRAGDSRFFYVQEVVARRREDSLASISIELSRVTLRLPEYLIRRELKDKKVSFKCVKRVVGRVSYVFSEGFIPKDVIKAAGKELDERISVEYPGKKKRGAGQ